MADLQQTIIGALRQAGLNDPRMLQEITASVMQGLGGQPPHPMPGFGQPTGQPAPMAPVGQAMGRQLVPGFSGPAPSELYGYEGQPNRDLLASQSYGRGPAPASIDPTAESDMMAAIDAERGGGMFGGAPQGVMPPGSPAMGPGTTAAPSLGGVSLAGDATGLRKPQPPGEPGLVPRPVNLAPKRKGMFGKAAGGMLSESDRLNWSQVLAHGGQVPPAIRAMLGV